MGSGSSQEWEVEPFTGKKVRSVEEFTDNAEENRRKSLARTKAMIGMYARSAAWEWFVTLTFAPNKADRENFGECMGKARNWFQNARKRLAPDLQYLVVPELHADGKSWHVHALLSATGNMEFVDSGRKKNGQDIYNLSGWSCGFSTATKVRDIYRVQKYILKYITKECHAMAAGAHRYYVSNNLPMPKESVFCVEPGEQERVIKEIADSLGVEVSYRSGPKGNYVTVEYLDLC